MTLQRPILMQPASGDPDLAYSALVFRGLFDNMFTREGVADVASLLVHERAAGANFTVEIDPGAAVIRGDDVAGQGLYSVRSDAVFSVTIPAAPGSGTVTHRVIARIRDKLHNAGWTTYDWNIELLEDTGTGTPAEPPSAITLATVAVSAGQASVTDGDITDLRPYPRHLRTNVTGITVGFTTVVVTADTVSSTLVSGLSTPGTNHTVFTTSRSSVPGVDPDGSVVETSASGITATEFTLNIYRDNNVDTAVSWMHVGFD